MGLRTALQRVIRPSTTQGTASLWAKSLLNAALFFLVFMVALPWLAHRLLPWPLPIPAALRAGGAALLGLGGGVGWLLCLDAFSRLGRGTPLPMDAPRRLVTAGPFVVVRNPIMASEILVLWAVALHVSSAGVALYALAVSVAAHLVVVHVEEPELRRRFGESYEQYCQRVPRWIPKLWKRRRIPSGEPPP